MAHIWREYISQIHSAEPLDPWVTNVQLLDIFIKTSRSWLPCHRAKRTRIGSLLNLGNKDGTKQWKENVADPITTGLQRLDRASDATELGNDNMFHEDESMPDMQASIKSTTSLLGSIFAGKSADAQFNSKGVKSANCVVTGVKSRRVRLDALMDLVNQRGVNEPAWWRPNTWRPEFRWSSKRGKTIWVVTEILYATKISLEIDNGQTADGVDKISTVAKVEDVKVSKEAKIEKDKMWSVTATQQKAFPFAYRTVKLEYDADGILRQADPLTKIANKPSPSQPMAEELHRSASVSKSTPNTVAASTKQ